MTPPPAAPIERAPAPAAPAPVQIASTTPPKDTPPESTDRTSEDWMLAVAAVTHAPVDVGAELGLETPVGLRFFGGYGWVPGVYKNLMIDAAVSATGEPLARDILQQSFDGGRVFRFQVGIRPFRKLGLYLDAGVARMKLSGSFDTSQIVSVPGLTAQSYTIESNLTLGSLELGYQGLIADHMLIALGVGVTKILSADTSVSGQSSNPSVTQATSTIDDALVKYGVVPTLNLRLGFDLI
jgi:hypothetical protein